VEKDQRVPADMVLLRTKDRNARCFIRTDQLDGETDWKLRLPILQEESNEELFDPRISIYAEKPQRDIHSFIGTLSRVISTGLSLYHKNCADHFKVLFTLYFSREGIQSQILGT